MKKKLSRLSRQRFACGSAPPPSLEPGDDPSDFKQLCEKQTLPYLPPFEGLVREGAVLPGHQRVDGLIEALREPGVAVVQLGHATPAGAWTLGEEVVRLTEGVLDEVERGVPEGVAEEQRGEGEDAKEQGKGLDLPPLGERHVGRSPKGKMKSGGSGLK